MKRMILMLALTGGLFLFFQSFQSDPVSEAEFPDEVSKLLVSACYDCHTTGAKAEDAVKALDFKEWDKYRLTKQVALLGDICKMLEEGKMPPKKYLEYKPDRKLSEAEKKMICDWTKKESEKLMGED